MVRGLITGTDGVDVLVAGPRWPLPVAPGGVEGVAGAAEVPFGLVELVVVAGVGAGEVHRLEVGRYRVGDEGCDLQLPGDVTFTLDVRCGGEVWVLTDGWTSWPVGERRRIGDLDLQMRWCAPPRRTPRSEDPLLADLLLDRLAGVPVASNASGPRWYLGHDSAGRAVTRPLAAAPVLTISGPDRHAAARAVLARLVAERSADDVRLTVLAPTGEAELAAARWSWIRWLPHARASDERFVRFGTDDPSCGRLVADAVAGAAGDGWEVIVVDGTHGRAGVRTRPGMAVVVLDEEPMTEGLHVMAGESPRLDGGPALVLDLPGVSWADRLARTLTTLDAPRVGDRLFGLLDLDPADPAAVTEAWEALATTRVPLGPGDDGVVEVDLRRDGPHALVAGTTGSGKSELLRTLVTGLAAANPPEAMSFVLIDYKGGSAFADCGVLPHVLGLVTDLDARLTERAISSLSAEIRRRERLLAASGTVDLDAYLAAGHGPLARLVIVVDEFATLAAELPDFVDGLVDIARRGRSLGIHLVLATQRPAGAVSADIRANTTLRIALRVTEAADSLDVIGVPDAVDLDERRPGSALVCVGRNTPEPVAVSRVTTASGPVTQPYVFGRPVDDSGQGRSDVATFVETAWAVVQERGIPVPPSPWLPPLPATVPLEELPAGEDDTIVIGVEDRTAEQRQVPATISLTGGSSLAIAGTSRSGRTTTLLTVAAAAMSRFAPPDLHVYAIEASSFGLVPLVGLPHVGSVVVPGDGRLERLVARLGADLDARIAAAAGVGADVGHPGRQPRVLVLIDRWDLLSEALDTDERTVLATLERIATDGPRVGMTVVATGDRSLLTGRLLAVFADRLALRLADPFDYAPLGVAGPAGHGEPGRGWRGEDVVETQIALAQVTSASGGAEPTEGEPGGPWRIEPMPMRATRSDMAVCSSGARLLIGVGGDALEPSWIDADEVGPTLLVTGPRRSGRSGTLTTLAESALEAGWQVAVVTGRRSPLSALAATSERVYGPFTRDEQAGALREAVDAGMRAGRMLVVADDVDLLADGELLDVLTGLPGLMRDSGSLFVGAADATEVLGAYRGPLPALRRARSGVMLSPSSLEEGEAFGVRLRRWQFARPCPPGGGLLVIDGLTDRVQVLLPELQPQS
ncbi:MAG: FtsK/SpoIIIE domain-containing protein [Mobilicoccus sp.]|nr:FtsK/SpoIIIE domain-containing protein [Mobilicoccus sp.]